MNADQKTAEARRYELPRERERATPGKVPASAYVRLDSEDEVSYGWVTTLTAGQCGELLKALDAMEFALEARIRASEADR